MKCTVCGGELNRTMTDLPFKIGESSIVILKGLPVLQCAKCPEYLIRRVDEILAKVESGTELEIVRYAA